MSTDPIVVTDPVAIQLVRLSALRAGLKLEAKGMKRSGRSCLSMAKAEGYVKARTASEALVELENLITKLKERYGYA